MNKIHRRVEYALIALKHMKQKPEGELTTVKEVCRQYACSFDATSRVMQTMVQKGLLKSEQGAFGGYSIRKNLKKVNLYELIEMVVGPIGIVRCLNTDQGDCDMEASCNVIAPLAHLNKQIIQFYNKINIDEMLNITSKKRTSTENMMTGRV